MIYTIVVVLVVLWLLGLIGHIGGGLIHTLTASGAVIGTVKYMAPEQVRDGASVAPTADIYALGAILYECLSGVTPHSGASVQELMFKVMNVEPVPLVELRPEVPSALARAVHRALSKRAEERFSVVAEFARAIAPFAEFESRSESVEQSATLALDGPPIRSSKRSPWPMLLTGLVLGVVLSVGVAGLSRHSSQSAPDSTLQVRKSSPRVATPLASTQAMTVTALPPTHLEPSAATPAPRAAPVTPMTKTRPPAQAKSVSSSGPALSFPRSTFEVENPYAQ